MNDPFADDVFLMVLSLMNCGGIPCGVIGPLWVDLA